MLNKLKKFKGWLLGGGGIVLGILLLKKFLCLLTGALFGVCLILPF